MSRGSFGTKLQEKTGFSQEELRAVKRAFTARKKIEDMLSKNFYEESKTHQQNIQNLCRMLGEVVQIEPEELKQYFMESFKQFLQIEENIPIQINIRKLRYEQLNYLIDEWELGLKQPSLFRGTQRLYSIQHRNMLFSRVFVQQKQNIQGYFQTLSQKKMLKGVDLYQLLTDILSHYFLYEFKSDNETFFEKVNSFNNFLEVVDKFINSEKRIIIDNKSKDFQYIKLYEFQALIYFWQTINPELELRSDKRFSNESKEVQTERHEIFSHMEQSTQTVDNRQKAMTIEEVINQALRSLNKLTEEEGEPEKLQVIQNICEALRKEKIRLGQLDKNLKTKKKSQSPSFSSYFGNGTNESSSKFLDVSYNNASRSNQLIQTQRQQIKPYENHQKLQPTISIPKDPKKQYEQPAIYRQTTPIESLQHQKNQESIKIRTPDKPRLQLSYLTELENFQPHNITIQSIRSKDNTSLNSNEKQIGRRYTQVSNYHKRELSRQRARGETSFSEKSQSGSMKGSQQTQKHSFPTSKDQSYTQLSLRSLLQQIYSHYSTNSSLSLIQLQRFFNDMGIIQEYESLFDLKIFRDLKLLTKDEITRHEFIKLMTMIMKQDEDLTYEVIAEFVEVYVGRGSVARREQKSSVLRYEVGQGRSLNGAGNSVVSGRSQVNPGRNSMSKVNAIMDTYYKDKKDENPTRSRQRSKSPIYSQVQRKASYSRVEHEKIYELQGRKSQQQFNPSQSQGQVINGSDSRRRRYQYYQETPKFQQNQTDPYTFINKSPLKSNLNIKSPLKPNLKSPLKPNFRKSYNNIY